MSAPIDPFVLARAAVDALVTDAGGSSIMARRDRSGDDDDGLFGFTVRGVSILVPGLPVDEIKARSPLLRLYVDGNSWGWPYAVEIVRDIIATDGTR